jgi:hypothetical protein
MNCGATNSNNRTQEENQANCKDCEIVTQEQLKLRRNAAIRIAQAAAHEYFCECELGPERERASMVYENIRNATRYG